MLEVASRIDDYEIVRELGGGGMGAVYVAKQLSTGRLRALKTMHPQFAQDAGYVERFIAEAQVGARIDSEHVVEVIGAGFHRETRTPWLAMELLDGESLADRVERRGPLSRADARLVFEQLCHGIAAAHRAGIVHRDLKPENVFVANSKRAGASPIVVKILDFGIAKWLQEATSTGSQAIGTPYWMAPEQASRSGRIGPRTDIWALGLMAFHALTGRPYWHTAQPNTGSTLQQILTEMLVEPIEPPNERARALGLSVVLPDGFDAWFARCVARDPGERYETVDACLAALLSVLAPSAPGLASAPVRVEPTDAGRSGTLPLTVARTQPLPQGAPPLGARPLLRPALALGIAGVLGAGAIAIALAPSGPSAATPPASHEIRAPAASPDVAPAAHVPERLPMDGDAGGPAASAADAGGSSATRADGMPRSAWLTDPVYATFEQGGLRVRPARLTLDGDRPVLVPHPESAPYGAIGGRICRMPCTVVFDSNGSPRALRDCAFCDRRSALPRVISLACRTVEGFERCSGRYSPRGTARRFIVLLERRSGARRGPSAATAPARDGSGLGTPAAPPAVAAAPSPSAEVPGTPSRADVTNAMNRVSARVADCIAHGTEGVVTVQATFAGPTGRVTSAEVRAASLRFRDSLGGTTAELLRAERRCIEDAVRTATVAPFRGGSHVASHRFRVDAY